MAFWRQDIRSWSRPQPIPQSTLQLWQCMRDHPRASGQCESRLQLSVLHDKIEEATMTTPPSRSSAKRSAYRVQKQSANHHKGQWLLAAAAKEAGEGGEDCATEIRKVVGNTIDSYQCRDTEIILVGIVTASEKYDAAHALDHKEFPRPFRVCQETKSTQYGLNASKVQVYRFRTTNIAAQFLSGLAVRRATLWTFYPADFTSVGDLYQRRPNRGHAANKWSKINKRSVLVDLI